jgi:asparagine synthase (glutamine-hydrolysing)
LFDGNAEADPLLLRKRIQRLHHRGPEATGLWHDGHVALAHTRLKLLDYENGNQPMCNPRGVVLAYNGEIYNNMELRAELCVHGYDFKTRSDTEVLLAAYDVWGTQAWKRLNGMFAFALYDPHKGYIILVRDRLGIKPLFYRQNDHGIEFASEPSVWDDVCVSTSLNRKAIIHYLRYAHPCLADRSLHSEVRVLEPGTALTADRSGNVRVSRWFSGAEFTEKASVEDSVVRANIRHLLHLSVGRQMMADAPVGVFLSGGVDSAILTGLYSQMSPDSLHTYTIAVQGDESEFRTAKAVSKRWRTHHKEVVVSPSEFFSAMKELIRIRQLPTIVPNEVLIFLLAKRARHDVKVVLTGEGADELFGGYTSLLNKLHSSALASKRAMAGDDLLLRALRIESPFGGKESHSGWFTNAYAWFQPQELKQILNEEWKRALEDHELQDSFGAKQKEFKGLLGANQVHALLEFVHLPALLSRLDGATMAASLEGRVPYTDNDLVNYMITLPAVLKFSPEQTGKKLLRQTFEDLLPPEVADQPKRAFNVPLEALFNSAEGRREIENMLGCEAMSEIFDLRQLGLWMNTNPLQANCMKLWLLVSLSRWLNRNTF